MTAEGEQWGTAALEHLEEQRLAVFKELGDGGATACGGLGSCFMLLAEHRCQKDCETSVLGP